MPKIREYSPSLPKVSPSDRATAAWETAGRRIGPLYNEAAQAQRQAGAVQGQEERDKIWPFDIYALDASNAKQIRQSTSNETTSRTSQGGTTITGRGAAEDNFGISGVAGGAIDPRSYPAASTDDSSNWSYSYGEASAGAVGMSRLARAVVNDPYYNGQEQTVDPDTGIAYTPYQSDRLNQAKQKQADQDRTAQMRTNDYWDRQLSKWQTSDDKYYDQFNKNRDQGVYDDQKASQTDYNKDLQTQDKTVKAYMKKNPDADIGAVRQSTYEASHVTQPVQSDYGSYSDDNSDYRIRYGTPTVGDYVGYAPRAVVDSVKGAFNSMFGNQDIPDE